MTKEIRAQIDTEVVKGLLLINGGGVVALLAFLPSILDKDGYAILVKAVLAGLLLFQVGLLFAVIHNRLRRECSLTFEQYKMSPPACDRFPLKYLKFKRDPPCVCRASIIFMWLSVACFFVGGVVVTVGGFISVDTPSAQVASKVDQPEAPNKAPQPTPENGAAEL